MAVEARQHMQMITPIFLAALITFMGWVVVEIQGQTGSIAVVSTEVSSMKGDVEEVKKSLSGVVGDMYQLKIALQTGKLLQPTSQELDYFVNGYKTKVR